MRILFRGSSNFSFTLYNILREEDTFSKRQGLLYTDTFLTDGQTDNVKEKRVELQIMLLIV